MTKIKARKILGITPSAGIKAAKKAYHQKAQTLRLCMVPGNPCSLRQQAKQELSELTEAWNVLKSIQSRGKSKPKPLKPAEPDQTPQDMTETWERLISIAIVLLFVGLILYSICTK